MCCSRWVCSLNRLYAFCRYKSIWMNGQNPPKIMFSFKLKETSTIVLSETDYPPVNYILCRYIVKIAKIVQKALYQGSVSWTVVNMLSYGTGSLIVKLKCNPGTRLVYDCVYKCIRQFMKWPCSIDPDGTSYFHYKFI